MFISSLLSPSRLSLRPRPRSSSSASTSPHQRTPSSLSVSSTATSTATHPPLSSASASVHRPLSSASTHRPPSSSAILPSASYSDPHQPPQKRKRLSTKTQRADRTERLGSPGAASSASVSVHTSISITPISTLPLDPAPRPGSGAMSFKSPLAPPHRALSAEVEMFEEEEEDALVPISSASSHAHPTTYPGSK